MPYPAQIDRVQIVEMARTLIERDGAAQLSLATLAGELGVKPPSLYRHVPSKAALLQAVNIRTLDMLFAAYAQALRASGTDPRARLLGLLLVHRAFAHAHPATYMLAFTTTTPEERPDPALLERQAMRIQELMAAISGPERSLAALRGALALAHGYAMLELGSQLQRGGDLDADFEQACTAYLRGWDLHHRDTERTENL